MCVLCTSIQLAQCWEGFATIHFERGGDHNSLCTWGGGWGGVGGGCGDKKKKLTGLHGFLGVGWRSGLGDLSISVFV